MEYDAVIIGSGIGGLVCGCYLSKAGMKIMILEKNTFPGGCCSSFKRKGFCFDSGVHALGGFGPNGVLEKIFLELDLFKHVELIKLETTDVIFLDDLKIYFKRDIDNTIEDIKSKFPYNIKEIDDFFKIILDNNYFRLYSRYKNITYESFLNKIFTNTKLKSIFSVLLGNINLPPSMVSALTVISLYKRFVIEGGCYPKGGMQRIPDSLVKVFCNFGGTIKYKNMVKSIEIRKDKACGVKLENGEIVRSKYVISNGDCLNTFTSLIDKNILSSHFSTTLKNMLISGSNFVVYAGIKDNPIKDSNLKYSIWYLASKCEKDEIENLYRNPYRNFVDFESKDFLISFPSLYDDNLAPEGHAVAIILVTAPFVNQEFWLKNKKKYEEKLIKRVDRFINGFSKMIVCRDSASPCTLHKYTLNSQGAMNGWASIPKQNIEGLIPQFTEIENLFIVGHWVTGSFGQGGVPMVAYSGRKLAKKILYKYRKI